MGVSLRAYARHREVSDTAVRKAIKSGRIQTEPDGTIDVDKVDKQWALNTDQAQQRKPKGTTKAIPKAALDAVAETLNENGASTGGTTYMQARTANEVLKAQTNRIKLQQLS
ncbi:bacteriophage-related protein [methanotrophic bacterial endosymbiont of Bathymodiolus sp.]|jgi:hypothetical protein|nr:bacteriophage-related protein [methanotrophic bacterial endosymbiont of Bathymodiolus sp.]